MAEGAAPVILPAKEPPGQARSAPFASDSERMQLCFGEKIRRAKPDMRLPNARQIICNSEILGSRASEESLPGGRPKTELPPLKGFVSSETGRKFRGVFGYQGPGKWGSI